MTLLLWAGILGGAVLWALMVSNKGFFIARLGAAVRL